jgi:peptide/nickel transport system ATP-binding protein
MSGAMLAVEKLVVAFGEEEPVRAVDGVSFSLPAGECFGLVGESGCGKSTVLRAIAGLNPDHEGRVSLAGETLPRRRGMAHFRLMQMVFQDPYGSLHPRQTVQAQLLQPLEVHGLDRRQARVTEALDSVGLPATFRFRYPHQLSGGQRQRVAIARALILQPRVLLLDEPTSALDVSVQAEVLNLLGDIGRARDLTMVLVSHDLAVVATMCDRVGVMRGGQLVEIAASKDFARGQFESDYARQLLAASRGYDREMARRMALEESI